MSITYDYIIVGGGPSAILCAYNLAKNRETSKILILEKNDKNLNDYKNKDYDELQNWLKAQIDSDYQYSFLSTDEKSVWLGKGLGGGTLHFGLQYIDQEKLITKDYEEWQPHFEDVANITEAERYTYSETNSPNEKWQELYNCINSKKNSNTLLMNNKIYGKDIDNDNKERLLLGDLLEKFIENERVEVQYGKSVKNISINDDGNAKYLTTFNNEKFYGNKIILCSGAIQTPAILQRSGYSEEICGNKLFDHAGFYLSYCKKTTTQKTVSEEKVADYTNDELTSLGLNIYNIGGGGDYDLRNSSLNSRNKAMHAIFRHTKLSDSDVNKAKNGNKVDNEPRLSTSTGVKYVYNMGDYWNGGGHRGGSQFGNLGSDYDLTDTLIWKHGNNYNYRLMSYKADARLVGVLRESVENTIQTTETKESDLGLDAENIIGHLQTRDNDLKWQTYLSTVPGDDYKGNLIVTFAQSTNLSGSGNVKVEDKENDVPPKVTLNHFMVYNENGKLEKDDKYIEDLYNCFQINHNLLKKCGFSLDNNIPESIINRNFIELQSNSIYHYHGTAVDVVNENNKVNDTNNVYIGDISILRSPWGGSTSVPAAVTGYLTAKNIIDEEDQKNRMIEEENKKNEILFKYKVDEEGNSLVILKINQLDKNNIYSVDFYKNQITYSLRQDEIEEKIDDKYDVVKYYVKKNEKDTNSNFIFNKDQDEINRNIGESIEFVPNNIYIIENLENNNLNFGTSWNKNESNIVFISNSKNEKKVKDVSCINKNETIIFSIVSDYTGDLYCFSYDNEEIIDKLVIKKM